MQGGRGSIKRDGRQRPKIQGSGGMSSPSLFSLRRTGQRRDAKPGGPNIRRGDRTTKGLKKMRGFRGTFEGGKRDKVHAAKAMIL